MKAIFSAPKLNSPKKRYIHASSAPIVPTIVLEMLLSATLQERAKVFKWTQRKIESVVESHNTEVLTKLSKKQKECERCGDEVTPFDVQRLPQIERTAGLVIFAHFFDCSES